MVVAVGKIKEILLQRLQGALTDEGNGHVEILTAAKFILDAASHRPSSSAVTFL